MIAIAAPGLFAAVGLSSLAAPAAADPSAPPPVSILTSLPDFSNSDLFITPTGDSATYANGPEIIDRNGNVVWFHAIPQGLTASDFRTQTYHGQPVLTWWQGTGLGGLAQGTDYIYNEPLPADRHRQRRQRPERGWP